jgi:hypothetical protein
MDSVDKLDLLEADYSLSLYNEFKEAIKVFKYHIDTDLRTYLANDIAIETLMVGDGFYFKVTLTDAWVYEAARTQRFVPEVTLYEITPVHVQRLREDD